MKKALCALVVLVLALPAFADTREPPIFAVVAFTAEPVSEDDMGPRTVAVDEPFLVQRLSVRSSATLQSQIDVRANVGAASLPIGTRLLAAASRQGDFYCGTYDPHQQPGFLGGAYEVQWVCLHDDDNDGVFDTLYSTPLNPGAVLPAFQELLAPQPVHADYTIDDVEHRDYFESAIVYHPTFNIYGRLLFELRVRRAGDTQWRNIASSLRGVEGGYTSVSGSGFPQSITLGRAQVTVTGKGDRIVTVDPDSAPVGVMAFGTSTTRRY